MKEIFSSGTIPREINRTLLVIIPKIDNPLRLTMYRPISLCTVVYKTVTKIIANRSQSILSHLIGPHQTSFVPGRHIIENTVVAKDVIHSMRNKRGKRGQMAIKVDLKKAYDRLSWGFIHDTLLEVAIPITLVHIIMECITTAPMNVLWNGELTDEFIPSRGIRQWDTISPYIFVLCIERLSHGICQAVNMGKWHPVRLSRNGTPLTHLFFADDLLLLAEASCEQAKILTSVLDTYCDSSGPRVSKAKTQTFFSNNVKSDETKMIGNILGFSITNDLGKYLGMPLLHSRVTKKTYQSITDKVEKRLSGWNASHLSLVRRITLAQSVVQSIPIYALQTVNLPVSIKAKIDNTCKKFIWGGANPQ